MLLLVSLAFVVVMGGAMFWLAEPLQRQNRIETQRYWESVARTIAESGLEKTLADLRNGKPVAQEFTQEFGQGAFVVKVSTLQATLWHIESRGLILRIPALQAYVKARVERQGDRLVILSWTEGKLYGK
jgi:hypothetical protein